MKQKIILISIFSFLFSCFAQNFGPPPVPHQEERIPFLYHGKYLDRNSSDFKLVLAKLFRLEKGDAELVLMFTNPLNPESLEKASIKINGKKLPENFMLRFSKDGTKIRIFLPQCRFNPEEKYKISVKGICAFNEIEMEAFEEEVSLDELPRPPMGPRNGKNTYSRR